MFPGEGKNRGFTLIELLVVIAIIAILAAILFPIFATAKEAGRRTACASNMGMICKSMRLYADEWNGRLPWANSWNYCNSTYTVQSPAPLDKRTQLDPLWVGTVLKKYEGNKTDLWRCPSTPYSKTNPHFYYMVYYYNLFCYDVSDPKNVKVCPDVGSTTVSGSLSGQPMDRPVFYTEYDSAVQDWGKTGLTKIPVLWDQRYTYWDQTTNYYAYTQKYDLIHINGWNVLYIDGHTKYFGRDDRNWINPK